MDINCPYCDAEQDICHDDGFGYSEGVKHQMQCDFCKKYFVFETSISFDYDPSPADCLNGGEHDWKPSATYPVEFTTMECTMCDETRKPTDYEMKSIIEKRSLKNGNKKEIPG